MLRSGGGRRPGTPNVPRAGEGDLEALVVTELLGRGQRAYRATLLFAALRVWLHPNGKAQELILNRRAIERIRRLLACDSRTAWSAIDFLQLAGRVRLTGGRQSPATGSAVSPPRGATLTMGGDSWGPCRVWARVSRELYRAPGLSPFEILLAGHLAARNGWGLTMWNLAEDFGLSRMPILRGLQRLREGGLIYADPGPRRRLLFHAVPPLEGPDPQSSKRGSGRAANPAPKEGSEQQIPGTPPGPSPAPAKVAQVEQQIPHPQSSKNSTGRAAEVAHPLGTLDSKTADKNGRPPQDASQGALEGRPPDPDLIQAAAGLLERAGIEDEEPALTRGPLLSGLARRFLEPPGRTLALLEAIIEHAVQRARTNPAGLLRDYLETPGRLEKVIIRVAPKVVPKTTLAEARADSERQRAGIAGKEAEFREEREVYMAQAGPRLEATLRELTGLPLPELPELQAAAEGFTSRHAVTGAYGALHAWATHQVLPTPKERHELEHLAEAAAIWKKVAKETK